MKCMPYTVKLIFQEDVTSVRDSIPCSYQQVMGDLKGRRFRFRHLFFKLSEFQVKRNKKDKTNLSKSKTRQENI